MKNRVFCVVMLVAFVAGGAVAEGPVESTNLELITLYDHQKGPPTGEAIPDWGYSALIRYRGQTILFDGGSSPVILEHNSKALGVGLTEVDIVVLSHRHSDHTGGINYLVSVHPHVAVYVPYDFGFGSADPDADPKLRKAHRWLTDEYYALQETTEIAEGIHLIHTASPYTGNYWKYPPFDKEPKLFPLNELSLALDTENGDVLLVVGCSHSGVDEIVKATREALDTDIALVTGGFHLMPYDKEYVAGVATSMKNELGVKRVGCTHCSGDEAIAVFNEIFGENSLWAGLGAHITFPE